MVLVPCGAERGCVHGAPGEARAQCASHAVSRTFQRACVSGAQSVLSAGCRVLSECERAMGLRLSCLFQRACVSPAESVFEC